MHDDEQNGDQVEVPSGMVELTLGEHVWLMDLLGSCRAMDKFRESPEAQADGYAYCDHVKGLAKAAGGPDLNDTQADWLADELYRLWVAKKKQRASAMSATPESPSSTE